MSVVTSSGLSPSASNTLPVIIVGASHAAVEAVTSLRRAGWEGAITVVGNEPYLPYQRPPLSKAYLKGGLSRERLEIRNAAFYDKQRVVCRLGVHVVEINRHDKHIVLASGEVLPYAKLILATGTLPKKLPADAVAAEHLWYLRTIADVDRITAQLQAKQSLLIVGAGYIGLEVAAAVQAMGVDVTVMEAQSRVLARVTGEQVAAYVTQVHRQHGVKILTACTLEALRYEHSTWSATLSYAHSDCREVATTTAQFDHVLVGIGVVPNIELAQAAGLDCDNGVVVDAFCQTCDPDVYAVGDCANYPSHLYGQRLRLESVPNAVGHAKTAALHICEQAKAYDDVPWFWSDQYHIKLQTAGVLTGFDQSVLRGDIASGVFAVFYLRGGVLIAVDAVNSPPDFMVAKQLVAKRTVLTPAQIISAATVKDLLSL